MAHHDHHEHPDDGGVYVHVHPTKFYAGILGSLLVLTVLTVAVSYVDIDGFLAFGREVEGMGTWNLIVAILIATMKATLVVLFFMHLKDDKRFNALVFVGGLLFIGVFFAYTMNDTNTRGQTGDPFNGVHIDPQTGERAPGGIDRQIPGQALEEGLELGDDATEGTPTAAAAGAEATQEAIEGQVPAAEEEPAEELVDAMEAEADGAADEADLPEADDAPAPEPDETDIGDPNEVEAAE